MTVPFPIVAGYDLREIVGQGGAATIYEALDDRHGRTVAIKVIDGQTFDEAGRRSFTRELRAMGRLGDHPHVVNVFDSGFTAAGRPFLVMPMLGNGTLSKRLAERGPLGVGEVLDLGIKIGSALETAHRRGILHCDIKPNNLLIGPWGEPMLADFGISSVANSGVTATDRSSLTLMYAAPEILDDELPTIASDIYSLGASLFTLANGSAAFAGDSPAAVVRNILTADSPPRLSSGAPPELSELIAEMMARDPALRPASAELVVTRLQAIQMSFDVAPTPAIIGDSLGPRASGAALTVERDGPAPTNAANLRANGGVPDPLTEGRIPTSPGHPIIPSEPQPQGRAVWPLLFAGAVVLTVIVALVTLRANDDPSAAPVSPTDEPDQVADVVETSPPGTATAAPAEPADDIADQAAAATAVVAATPFPSGAAPPPGAPPSAIAPADIARFALLTNPPDADRGTPERAHLGIVASIDWSAAGLIATGGTDSVVRIWDPSGAMIAELPASNEVEHVAWSPDGSRLAVADRSQITIWNLITGEQLLVPDSKAMWNVVWSSDGTRIASGTWHRVVMYNVGNGATLYIGGHESGTSWWVDLNDDGRLVTLTSDGDVLEWDTTVLGDPTTITVLDADTYSSSVTYLDDGQLMVGAAEQPILFFEPNNPEPVRELEDLQHPVRLWQSPDRKRLASLGQNSIVRIWDLEAGTIIAQINAGLPAASGATWSPDGTRVAVGGHEGHASIYDISDLGAITQIELRAG